LSGVTPDHVEYLVHTGFTPCVYILFVHTCFTSIGSLWRQLTDMSMTPQGGGMKAIFIYDLSSVSVNSGNAGRGIFKKPDRLILIIETEQFNE
jgi:hypothetical protein